MPDKPDLDLDIHCMSAERWVDLETLFGTKGASGGCWCMYWRLPRSQFDSGCGEPNRQAFKAVVMSGKPVGLLAYHEKKPVGWMAIAPREDYPTLNRSKILKSIDHHKVWSVSCFYIAARYRNQGVSLALLEHSKEYVKEQRGKIIEGYPIIPKKGKVSAGAAYTGLMSTFLQAGFQEVARYSASRPIMRYELKSS